MRLALFFFFLSVLSLSASFECRAAAFNTDISRAFVSAKKTGKPLLISFFGIWCPPCNELDETVFESLTFP